MDTLCERAVPFSLRIRAVQRARFEVDVLPPDRGRIVATQTGEEHEKRVVTPDRRERVDDAAPS